MTVSLSQTSSEPTRNNMACTKDTPGKKVKPRMAASAQRKQCMRPGKFICGQAPSRYSTVYQNIYGGTNLIPSAFLIQAKEH